MNHARPFATAAIVTLLLAGCQGVAASQSDTSTTETTESATPSPPASESASAPATSSTPSATPTATPTSTGKPALEDLTLSSEGIGYVRVGQPVPDVPKAERIVKWVEPFCDPDDEGGPGAWKTLYDTVGDGNLAFYVEAKEKDDPVTAIYVISDAIETEHGLHIGSTVKDVEALGGKHEESKNGSDEFYPAWVIHGSAGELVFFMDDKDTVTNIQVQAEGSEPVLAMEITPCA